MPEYLSPGVYIKEFESGAKPIEGVSTSTGGFLGVTEKGLAIGLPEPITSFADFKRKFGNYLPESYGKYRFLPYAVDSFFTNGGSRCYVMRVIPNDAEKAKNEAVPKGLKIQLTKNQEKTNTELSVDSLHGIDSDSNIKLEQLRPDGSVEHSDENLEIASYDRSKNSITLEAATPLNNDYLKKYTRITVTSIIGASDALNIIASSKGDWGEDIIVRSIPVSQAKTQIIENPADSDQYRIKNKNGFYNGAIVVFDNGTKKQYRRVTNLLDDIITLSTTLDGDVVDTESIPNKTLSTCEFTLKVNYKEETDIFNYMSMNPDTSNYFMKVVNDSSKFIKLESPYSSSGDFTRTDPFDMPTNNTMLNGKLFITLSDGNNGTISGLTPADFIGIDEGPGKRSGIKAFNDIDEVNIITAPGITDPDVQLELVSHCENRKDRFAVLDVPENYQSISKVQGHRDIFDSSYAAIYHPWMKIYDLLEKKKIFIPPSGSIMGIYSRSDQTRGVHKAPANEKVQNITDLKYKLNTGEQDLLNPKGVNLIRVFPGRGIRVWGARTVSSNTLWKYINVRRLFIYIEESIEKGTQWVVFEPNDEKLWARVRATITQFLTGVWRDGALMGTKAEEAFYVKCDRTTMTQDDIDNGRLICEIGISPVKPAEFVIFRITQWTGGSEVTE
ncbi:MAG: hypothetical protein C5S41_13320 [Candidatus Methanomarinus sp.]|nr:MAG: hypothetical protein C5S41_13320 [ANME-2 cluster archaeon]